MHDDRSRRGVELRKAFREKGFLFPCKGFSRTRAAKLLRGYLRYRERALGIPSLVALYNLAKPHLVCQSLDEVVHSRAILDVVEALIGPDLLAWSVDVFVKPSVEGTGVGLVGADGLAWHQDAPHLELSPLDSIVRVWVALTAATCQNGTIRYLPGSHLRGELPHAYTSHAAADLLRGERVCMDVDEGEAVAVVLEAGEFAVHDLRTVHDSARNQSRQDRVCVSITYTASTVVPTQRLDSAMLVRGSNARGHFALEPRPSDDFEPGAVEAYLSALALRAPRLMRG